MVRDFASKCGDEGSVVDFIYTWLQPGVSKRENQSGNRFYGFRVFRTFLKP